MRNKLVNWCYFIIGIFYLLMAKTKKKLCGYSPKPFTTAESLKCIEYDIQIVDNWLKNLAIYKKDVSSNHLKDKNVLELGPGSDLGIGLYILSQSAKNYYAVDVYNMVNETPDEFYTILFDYFKKQKQIDTAPLTEQLNKTKNNRAERLNYICRSDFDIIEAVGVKKMDIIFSNAAFEHFDNVFETIRMISDVSVKGAILCISVDLITHSRWIREKDPNNIYRYPKWLYKILTTRSSPNRRRPYQYQKAFEECGWENIVIKASSTLEKEKADSVNQYLSKEFRDSKNQMNYKGVWIYATKK